MSDSKVSKAEQCRQFVAANPGLARKDYVKAFENLGCTNAGAKTYIQNIKAAAKKAASSVQS